VMKRIGFAVLLVLIFSAVTSAIGVDYFIGTSWHSGNPAKIGQYYISDPDWITRPFEDAPYFSARIRWGGHEIEWVHDKIYLKEDLPGIEGFNVSDGYNLLLYNVPQVWGGIEARIGLGVVVAHPEGIIDGHYIGSLGSASWRTGGIGGQVALGYRKPIWQGLSVMAEAKLTTGFLHADYPSPIDSINIPLTGRHVLLGIGYDF